MKIKRSEINLILERQREKDGLEKGLQPELTLGCFRELERDDTKYCERCEHYEITCIYYLFGFEIKESLRGW